jgi:hypothetical protein
MVDDDGGSSQDGFVMCSGSQNRAVELLPAVSSGAVTGFLGFLLAGVRAAPRPAYQRSPSWRSWNRRNRDPHPYRPLRRVLHRGTGDGDEPFATVTHLSHRRIRLTNYVARIMSCMFGRRIIR